MSVNITWYAITRFNYDSNTLGDLILMNNNVKTGADFKIIADSSNRESQEGLFSAPDEYGISYYFRGTHELNNNVIFAGYQWKIIRIDGSGNIKLIYNGLCLEEDCSINGNTSPGTIGSSQFNASPNNNQNRSLGYMFGSAEGTFAEQHANINDSTIKVQIDKWFSKIPESEQSKIAITNFCADRSLVSGSGLNSARSYYGGSMRLTNALPILDCPREDDKLQLLVGLISADEALMAGVNFNEDNSDVFLRTGAVYYTITPWGAHGDGNSDIITISTTSKMYIGNVGVRRGVRPVLSLKPNTDILPGGDGSAAHPYVVS